MADQNEDNAEKRDAGQKQVEESQEQQTEEHVSVYYYYS